MVDLVKVRKKAKEKKEAEERGPLARASEKIDNPPESDAPVTRGPEATAPQGDAPVTRGPEAPAPQGEPPVTRGPEAPAPLGAKLEHFRKTANLRGEAQEARQGEQVAEAEGEILELLLFTIAGEQYALPIEKIIEIVPPRRATRVPNADAAIVGIISLRGTIVSILDIRRKLGHPPLQFTGPDSRIIVLENAGETAGFLVDKVSRVVRVAPNRIGNHPVVSMSEQSEFIRGVFQHAERLSILLELETLLRYQG